MSIPHPMTSRNRKWPVLLAGLITVIALIYLSGPKPDNPDFSTISLPQLTSDLERLEDSIAIVETSLKLKQDNEARIVWSTPYKKTSYSIVYLHGNGASQEEGDPIHEALAYRYGSNLYLARLYDHGVQSENPLEHIDPVKWMQSALDAIAIGKAIGDKVIVVSCSTGSTFALYLAAHFPELFEAQILFSPNIDYYDPRSFLMSGPWGLQISRMILGSKFYGWKAPGAARQYWYTSYRIEGLIALKAIINKTMTKETFSKINQPLFMAYYYRDDNHQDKIVSVKRMREMYSQIATSPALKKEVTLTEAGTHIITSDLFTRHIDEVWDPLINYCDNVLNLMPVHDSDWKPFIDVR